MKIQTYPNCLRLCTAPISISLLLRDVTPTIFGGGLVTLPPD
jgi:hypothetical protein